MSSLRSSTIVPRPPIRPTFVSCPTSAPSTPPLTGTTDPGTFIIPLPPCSAWSCWTPSEHHAIIVSATIVGLMLVVVMIYVCVMHRKRKKRLRELERGPDFRDGDGGTGRNGGSGGSGSRGASRGKQGKGAVWWTGKGKGKGRARSRSHSRPRGIEGLKNIELGPATARRLLESGGLGTSRGVMNGSESFAEGYDVSGPLQGGRRRGLDEGVWTQGEWRQGRAKKI